MPQQIRPTGLAIGPDPLGRCAGSSRDRDALARNRPNSDRIRPILGRLRPISNQSSRTRPTLVPNFAPESVNFGPMLTEFGQTWTELDQCWPEFRPTRAKLV